MLGAHEEEQYLCAVNATFSAFRENVPACEEASFGKELGGVNGYGTIKIFCESGSLTLLPGG
jgi:hypothetical protein